MARAAGKEREAKGVTEQGRRKMSYCSCALMITYLSLVDVLSVSELNFLMG